MAEREVAPTQGFFSFLAISFVALYAPAAIYLAEIKEKLSEN